MRTFRGCCIVTLFGLLTTLGQAQLVIDFNYSLDTNGFFTAPRQATLNAAASYLSGFLTGQMLSPITPTGTATTGERWNAAVNNPQTGTTTNFGISATVPDHGLTIVANHITVYVGARTLSGIIADGQQSAFTYTSVLGNTIVGRGVAGLKVMPSVGSIAFDTATSWYFDNDITTVESFAGQVDFFSVAVHELIHVLGNFSGSPIVAGANTYNYGWTTNINTVPNPDTFIGTNAVGVHGGPINLASDDDHWADSITQSLIAGNPQSNFSQDALMDPTFSTGIRKYLTELDLAGLKDIGLTTNESTLLVNINAIPEPSTYALLFGAGALTLTIWSRRRLDSGKATTPSGQPVVS